MLQSLAGTWVAVVVIACGLLAGVSARAAALASRAANDEAIVETADGPVRGTVHDDARVFQGIPYAAPPVGELRWQSPQPVTPWTEPREATAPGNRCPQPEGMPGSLGGGDEDCLYLNVTAPASATPAAPKPVMVWIHGGGFLSGSGDITDARRLAAGGEVVVVTINYRLGIFGYFGYPGLPGSGGFGLEDQQAALRWVQHNVAAFGGDPENVTLFGESAGGMSTCAQLTSPPAAALFQKAIIQSGSCLIDWPNNGIFAGAEAGGLWGSPEETQAVGIAVAEELGCAEAATAIDCLRRVPAGELMGSPLAPAFGHPTYGNDVLPENPADALREGRFQPMPVMSGTTRDEARTFVSFDPEPITAERYQALLQEAFGEQAATVAERYPLDAFDSPALAWATAMTDRVWTCPALESDRLFAERAPVYAFEFADRDAPPLFLFPEDLPGGAFHGAEIAYLFDFDVAGISPGFSAEQQRLSDIMIGYWTTFAHTGDPNAPGLPDWPAFNDQEPTPYVQSLGPGPEGVGPVDLGAEHQCAFWQDLREASPVP